MSSKRFIVTTLSFVLAVLIMVAGITIAIDPFFQYHTPWFGMKPVVTYSRYQNPGIEKNFNYDNVMMGNSLSENFRISVVNEALGGETAKFTMAGSHPNDWVIILDMLKVREQHPKCIMINLDPYILGSDVESESTLPMYLYDNDYLNDVNYLLNSRVFFDYTLDTIRRNIFGTVPEYDKIYLWEDDWEYGKDIVLKNYQRPEISNQIVDAKPSVERVIKSFDVLSEYFIAMPDTEFIFFFAPMSMAYWDSVVRSNATDEHKALYITACQELLKYDNTSVFFWADEKMISIMGDLDNYIDEAHYSPMICEELARRIKNREGLLTKINYLKELELFFEIIENYDYDNLFD